MHSLRKNSPSEKKQVVTKSSLLRNDKQLIGTLAGRRFPAGLQVFHDPVCHGDELFLHVEQLAPRIAVKVRGAEPSEQRVQLARQVRAGLGTRAHSGRFPQVWKEGKRDSACVSV